MTDITIPAEAVEAAARANYAEWVRLESAFTGMAIGDFQWWDGLDEESRDEWRKKARAACIAMLRNWPGMHIHEWQRPWLGGMSGADIILPLTESENE